MALFEKAIAINLVGTFRCISKSAAGMVTLDPVDEQGSRGAIVNRSEEHTSELQSLMRISYAVFCLKKKKNEIRLILHTCTTDLCMKKQHRYNIFRHKC